MKNLLLLACSIALLAACRPAPQAPYLMTVHGPIPADSMGKVLISHDAGWYTHGAPEQAFKPFTAIFRLVIPELEKAGFTPAEIQQLLVENPQTAHAIRL